MFVAMVRFYKALSMVGTDFFLMSKLFPSRSRKELKVIVCCTFTVGFQCLLHIRGGITMFVTHMRWDSNVCYMYTVEVLILVTCTRWGSNVCYMYVVGLQRYALIGSCFGPCEIM